MRADLTVDKESLAAAERSAVARMLLSSVQAHRLAVRGLERDLEQQTRAAAPGNAWRAWKSTVYPRAAVPAYEPVGTIFANGGHRSKGMLAYWSLAGINRAKGSRYLAVPMNMAADYLMPLRKQRGGGGTGDGDVLKFQRLSRIRLTYMDRPGKVPLLVAHGYMVGGQFMQESPAGAAAKRRGGQQVQRVTIPMFALIAEQPHANRVSIGAALQRATEKYRNDYYRYLQRNGVI